VYSLDGKAEFSASSVFSVTWSFRNHSNIQFWCLFEFKLLHFQKKGTKTVTGAVPFQKVNFCPF